MTGFTVLTIWSQNAISASPESRDMMRSDSLRTSIARLKAETVSTDEPMTGYEVTQKRNRRAGPERPVLVVPDEVLVVDDRARVRPAQVIESKLTRLLQEASVPVSHLQMRGLLKIR
jgi:hypothetical protein